MVQHVSENASWTKDDAIVQCCRVGKHFCPTISLIIAVNCKDQACPRLERAPNATGCGTYYFRIELKWLNFGIVLLHYNDVKNETAPYYGVCFALYDGGRWFRDSICALRIVLCCLGLQRRLTDSALDDSQFPWCWRDSLVSAVLRFCIFLGKVIICCAAIWLERQFSVALRPQERSHKLWLCTIGSAQKISRILLLSWWNLTVTKLSGSWRSSTSQPDFATFLVFLQLQVFMPEIYAINWSIVRPSTSNRHGCYPNVDIPAVLT